MLIFLLAFEISSVISYISLNLSRSSGDLISMISSIFPVRMSLNPATSSPVQMLARITGFICSRSYVFFHDFLSILIQFLTSNDWDARITICLCPDCRRACLGAQFRFVYCPFIMVDQLFSIVFICLKEILLSNYLSSTVYLY